jgi:hypothetical protein
MEAVRLVRNGQSSADVAKILGVPKGSLENWIRWDDNGSLTSGKDKVISQEQMELAMMNEIINWISFYNYKRLHSTLGYVSPKRLRIMFNVSAPICQLLIES